MKIKIIVTLTLSERLASKIFRKLTKLMEKIELPVPLTERSPGIETKSRRRK
jgi:hypothetical protein